MRILGCLVGALVLFPIDEPGAQYLQQHAHAIRQARSLSNKLLRTRQFDSAATFWTSDFIALTSLGARFDGPRAMREAFAEDSGAIYLRTPIDIIPSADWPIAWERGTWVGLLRSDTTVALLTGWYSARWLYEAGRWRIQSEQFVADACRSIACSWPLAPRRPAP